MPRSRSSLSGPDRPAATMCPVRRLLAILVAAGALLAACGSSAGNDETQPATGKPAPAEPPTSGRGSDDAGATTARLPRGTVTRGLDVPWELVFLPDGSALVTGRPGRVLRLDKRLRVSRT